MFKKKLFCGVLYYSYRVINTKIIFAYSCFIVIILFSSSLQLVELFWTHKEQIFEVNALTGNSVFNPKFHFHYRLSGEKENHWLYY